MYKVAICDDEIDCLKSLSKLLQLEFNKKDFKGKIITITDKQEIIYTAIKNHEIDILFLDVDFKNSGKNGIEFAKELRKINKDFYLIFLTAHYHKYMSLSFDAKTFDYLSKPTNTNSIEMLIDRLKDELKNNSNSKFLHLNKSLIIKVDDIMYIEKLINKCEIHAINGAYSYSISLNKLLTMLPDYFEKSHRSFIVNTDAISTIDIKNKCIIFNNGLTCPISSKFRIKEKNDD